MKKIEEQKNQLLHQFLERLNQTLPCSQNKNQAEEMCVHQYKLFVQMSFSANILYKGLDYAGSVYNHIVKVEYTRLCKEIIKHQFDKPKTEVLLKKLKKAQNELLLHSPLVKKSKGIDIFYGFTGGNRKKYKTNRDAIKKMYIEIKAGSERNTYRYIKDALDYKYRKIKEKKSRLYWLLKSYTWH